MNPVKLDLACGKNCQPGYEGVDIARVEGVSHVVNLLDFPWPFEDGSVDEIYCSHYVEHIPMLFWTPAPLMRDPETGIESAISYLDAPGVPSMARRLTAYQVNDKSVSLFLKFFDECHRIMRPGASMTVLCPQAHNDRAFQDPTHTQFIVPARFLYLTKAFRQANGLEHGAYGVQCDFELGPGDMAHTMSGFQAASQAEALRRVSPDRREALQQERIETLWNAVEDLQVTLRKPVPAEVPDVSKLIRVNGA